MSYEVNAFMIICPSFENTFCASFVSFRFVFLPFFLLCFCWKSHGKKCTFICLKELSLISLQHPLCAITVIIIDGIVQKMHDARLSNTKHVSTTNQLVVLNCIACVLLLMGPLLVKYISGNKKQFTLFVDQ